VIRKYSLWLCLLVIIVFGLVATRSLFAPGFYSSHDGITHVARLASFYHDLLDGQIIPRWSGGLSWGLGSPVLMYYGQVPYLLGLVPKLLGADFAWAIKIGLIISLVASGITFFLWGKEVFGIKAGLVGSILYMWAPYRFVDIFVRGAYPECVAFIFPPLMLFSIWKIFHGKEISGYVLGTLSLTGLILSHNVMAMFFIPIYICYDFGLFLLSKKGKSLFVAISALITSLFITAFYWLPAFFEKNEVNLNNLNASGSYLTNFVSVGQIIYSKWGWGPLGSSSPMSLQIGLVQLLVILLAVICLAFFVTKKKEVFHIYFFLGLFLISLFLMTDASRFLWNKMPLLSFVLYPWRFLAIAVFSSATLASLVVKVIRLKTIWIIALLGIAIYANRNYSQLVGKVYESNSYYENFQDTTDMWGEFLPVTANLDVISRCRGKVCTFERVVAPKDVKTSITQEKSNMLSFQYEAQKDFLTTINILSFPGWNAYLDNFKYTGIKINGSGTMDATLPRGKHIFELRFENTSFRKTAVYVSFVGLGLFGLYLICLKKYLVN
jgi:uncharacterized membrane protein